MTNVEELGEEIASLASHLDAATHRLLECIRQFDDAHGWHHQGAISCAHWLAWQLASTRPPRARRCGWRVRWALCLR